MSERIDRLLKAAGLQEPVLNSLERGESMFVLTEQTLLFQDSGGTRRVTLRDLKRIHSDQDGLLRVETPAGTALTANLVGFDPAAVQSFFAQVRDATARAKQRAGTTTLTPETAPRASAAVADAASSAPARPPQGAAAPAPGGATWTGPDTSAVVEKGQSAGQSPAAVPPARTVITAAPGAGTAQDMPRAAAQAPTAPTATGPTTGGLGLTSPRPTTIIPPPPPARTQEPQATAKPEATVKPMVKAVRTPTVISDPQALSPADDEPRVSRSPVSSSAVASPAEPSEAAAPAPRVSSGNGSAAGSLASLAAVAASVSAWTGALKAMSLIMLLATFGMAYFQYDRGQGINGFWTLIAGGMGAVALWVLSDLVKLLVSLAQAVSAEGGVMDVD